MPLDAMIDTSPGYIRIDSATVHDTVEPRRAVVQRRHRRVEQRRRHQDRASGRHRSARASTSSGSASAVRCRRDFPGESPGIVWDPAKWTEGALASVSIGYQVGVTPLQMVAAVGAIANGGEYVEPRVVRAVYRGQPPLRRPAEGRTPGDQRGHRGRADHHHGKRRRGRHRQAGADPGLHDRRQDRHRRQAGERALLELRLQRVVCRLPAVARSGARDHRGDRLAARPNRYYGGPVSAPIFRRIAEVGAALSGHLAVDRPDAPGARGAARRRDRAADGRHGRGVAGREPGRRRTGRRDSGSRAA